MPTDAALPAADAPSSTPAPDTLPSGPPMPMPAADEASTEASQTAKATLPTSTGGPHPKASLVLLVSVTLISLVADLVSKGWMKANLSQFDAKVHGLRKVHVIAGHVDFIFAQNPGGAWSFLRGMPDSLRRPFFLVITSIAVVFIIAVYRRVNRAQFGMMWGLPLALGGAIGNLVDRMRYGWVVDFVDMYITRGGREMHWPTYNVADIAIVVGVILMGIDTLRGRNTPHWELNHPLR